MGREEAREITSAEAQLLRLVTPLAKLTTGKQAVAIASEAPARVQARGMLAPSIDDKDRERDARASARSPSTKAGSARHANVASRAAPIPSKADPVSSAAVIVKKRARPRR